MNTFTPPEWAVPSSTSQMDRFNAASLALSTASGLSTALMCHEKLPNEAIHCIAFVLCDLVDAAEHHLHQLWDGGAQAPRPQSSDPA